MRKITLLIALFTTLFIFNANAQYTLKVYADDDDDFNTVGVEHFSTPAYDWLEFPVTGFVYTDGASIKLSRQTISGTNSTGTAGSGTNEYALWYREDPANAGTYQIIGRNNNGGTGTVYGYYAWSGITANPNTLSSEGDIIQTYADASARSDAAYGVVSQQHILYSGVLHGFDMDGVSKDGIAKDNTYVTSRDYFYRYRTDSGNSDHLDSATAVDFELLVGIQGYIDTGNTSDILLQTGSAYAIFYKDNGDGTWTLMARNSSGYWYSRKGVTTDPATFAGDDAEVLHSYADSAERSASDELFSLDTQSISSVSYPDDTYDQSLIYTDPPNCDTTVDTGLVNPVTGTISWSAATGSPSGYSIVIGTATGGSDVLTTTDISNVITYDVGALSEATTYYTTITPYNANGTATGCVEQTFTTFTPVANDECSNAVSLTVNTDLLCSVVTAGTTTYSTASSQTDDVIGTPNTDVWYSFIATGASHEVALTNITNQGGGTSTSTAMGMGVYDATGGCAGLSSTIGSSSTNTLELSSLSIGTSYYIRVYGSSSLIQNNNFDICVGTPPPPPDNDDCSGASAYTDDFTMLAEGACSGSPNTLDLSEATDDAGNDNPSCDSSGNYGVWYTWTATTNGLAFTSGTSSPGFAVYEAGSCGSLVKVGCLNNASGTITGLTISNDYIFYIWDDTAGTSVTFCLEEYTNIPLANDDCSGAIALSPGNVFADYAVDGSVEDATLGSETADCGSNGAGVWYSVVVPDDGEISIETGADAATSDTGFDSVIEAFSGSCGSLVSIDCDDDGASTGSFSLLELTGLTPGDTIYIRVWEYGGNAIEPFSISAHNTSIVITTTWTGGTDTDWATAGNWSNGVPTSETAVTIPSSLTNYPTATAAVSTTSVAMASGTSLIAESTFAGSITYNRNLASTNWYLVSSPVVGETMDDMIANHTFATGTAPNIGIAPYLNDGSAWDYQESGSTGSLVAAGGYSVKLASTGNISFAGTMPVADIGVAITSNTNSFNLIGNPYPSYIALNDLADGTNNIFRANGTNGSDGNDGNIVLSEDTVWFWDHSANSGAGGYVAANLASSYFIAPAQGFFVKSTGSNTFNFTEAMQSHQSSDTFQRTENNRTEITLQLTNGSISRDADIFYIDGTTTEFDNGYDSSMFSGVANEFAIYTHVVANGTGKNLGIQSLPNSDLESMIIPVGIKATSGTEITISANAVNLPTGLNVYLEDKQDATITLLDDVSDFSTTLDSDLNGIGRFYLHTVSSMLNISDHNLDHISVYRSAQTNLRVEGVQNGTANLKIYDMLGKQVLETSFEGNGTNTIPLPNVQNGVYIVYIETELGVLNKKIIL